jgi:hypothetical protein
MLVNKPIDKFLIYENFTQKEINLSGKLSSLKSRHYLFDSISTDIENFENFEGQHKVSVDLFNVLCDQDIINKWAIYKDLAFSPYSNNYKVFIEKRKQEIVLYDFGKVEVGKTFDSYLILATYNNLDNFSVFRTLYLINTKKNKLKSITQIALYTCFNGEINYLYTSIIGVNNFLLKEKVINSGIEMPDGTYNDTESVYSKYSYDKNGYVILP